jgi:CRP/FNR family transcriptional regulator, cyclic AMP receptor protein
MGMSFDEQIRLLSMVDVLESLSQQQLQTLAQRYPDISLDEGQHLYTPQDQSERLYFLKEGRVRIYRVAEGREVTLAMVEDGTVFGEMALTDQRLRDSFARAEQKSTVFAMDRQGLEDLILENPKVGLQITRLLTERLRVYEERLESLTLKQVPARLASLLLLLAESEGVMNDGKQIRIPTRYTHEMLSTMIGSTRAGVTRAFGRLQDEGAVELRRRQIHLKELETLKRVAEQAAPQQEEEA